MTVPRQLRAMRAINLFSGGSRTARPPQRLQPYDVRPPLCVSPAPLTIHDNFDRGSYTPNPVLGGSTSTSGHTWVNYRGTHKIGLLAEPGGGPNNSAAYCSNQTLSNAAVVGFDYGTTNVHLAARHAGGAGSLSRGLFLCFDGLAPGSSSQYTLNIDGMQLNKTVGATVTTLDSDTSPAGGAVIEVIKSGGDFEVYANGTLVYAVNDPSPLTGTRCGIFTRFDDTAPNPDSFYEYGYPYDPCDPEAFH